MVSKRREEESRRLLESEKAMSDIIQDDRTDRVCPRCAIATSLNRCPKCHGETVPMERSVMYPEQFDRMGYHHTE